MDEKWQDWHHTMLLPLLNHTPGDEPSPELRELLARDPTQVDLALLAAGFILTSWPLLDKLWVIGYGICPQRPCCSH